MESATSPVEFSLILMKENQKNYRNIVTVGSVPERPCCADKRDITAIQIEDVSKIRSNELNLVNCTELHPNPPPLILSTNDVYAIPQNSEKISRFHMRIQGEKVLVTMTMNNMKYKGTLYQANIY
ncbi:uncharacterized protein LOC130612750 isoform X2 [Hydractinia symbiolongicarpus]|nr:uncharacterized protein LOC130612750 isoform X2 [Hydractinia symbiolongicarpus]